jgi:hypothetical protein
MNVLTTKADLAELAEQINAAHAAVETTLRAGLEHARAAGALLVQAKAKAGHGKWVPWLRANARFSVRTAQAYMRVAERWQELEAKAQPLALLTFEEANQLLAKPASCTAEEFEAAHDQVDEAFRKTILAATTDPREKALIEAVFADEDRCHEARAQIHKEMDECRRVIDEVGATLAAGREVEPELFAELVRHNSIAGTWCKRYDRTDEDMRAIRRAVEDVRDHIKVCRRPPARHPPGIAAGE